MKEIDFLDAVGRVDKQYIEEASIAAEEMLKK